MLPPTELEQRLRHVSLRVTRPRMAVLAAVDSDPHADTTSIIRRVRSHAGDVSQQTVYDVLGVLSAKGVIRRIHVPGSVPRYEARVDDNHHHVVCRSCGAIADVDCVVGDAPCLEPSDAHGFAVDEAEVVFRGMCPECATTLEPQPKRGN